MVMGSLNDSVGGYEVLFVGVGSANYPVMCLL